LKPGVHFRQTALPFRRRTRSIVCVRLNTSK
jgi:hypothetical protein